MDKDARDRQARTSALIFGGALIPGISELHKAYDFDEYKDSKFADRVRRADYLYDNWEDSLYGPDGQQFGFNKADPRLTKAFINRGVSGLESVADDVFADAVGKTTEFAPADISQAGKFKPGMRRQSILTVTPEPTSQRFASEGVGDIGGGPSATLWGNDREPQYSYARGNYGVERVDSQNPSAHFSAVELPKGQRRDYLTTGAANAEGSGNTGWGRNVGNDLHFSKDFRKAGGLTTANDIVTYLRQQGESVPVLYANAGAENLEKLTKKLSEVTGKREYQALKNLASPQPTWGAPTRELGQLPVTTELNFRDGDSLKAGVNTFFKIDNPNRPDPDFRQMYPDLPPDLKVGIRQDVIDVDFPQDVSEIFGKRKPPLQRFAGNRLAGAAGSLLVSPEAARYLSDGLPIQAAAQLVVGGGLGELTGRGFNKAIDAATKRGIVSAPALARTASRFLTPVLAVDALDTASILATGKDPRELAVETGNEAPYAAASMAPMTMAPLGMAGSPFVQGNVSGKPSVYLRTESEIQEAIASGLVTADDPAVVRSRKNIADNKRKREAAQAARKRGGRFRIGAVALPEFGWSELLGIN
tara:strand:- start:734 stop:2497 length:1764 start_codon:yes stop_codon:yes gene_type:complete